MILVYPLLTSESVNPTLLPGIIKAVEKYIIINNTDDVLKHFNSALSGVVKAGVTGAITVGASVAAAAILSKGQSRIKKSGKELRLVEQGWSPGSAKVQGTVAQKAKADPPSATQQVVQGAADSIQSAAKSAGVKGFEMPKYDTVSLEPTWVQVHTNAGAKLIGVKVLPYKVKSTTGMVGLLMSDKELKKLSYLSSKMGRIASRVFWRAMRGLKIPGIKEKPITGNVKNDVILAQSQFGKNAFVCFSQLDLERDDIFTSAASVKRLQKLGWTSMIITDDVNKQATFCMKQFGGVCSTIPYSFIFSSLGKEHSQVYKDLEDAARSAGPFFRKKGTTRRKLFSK